MKHMFSEHEKLILFLLICRADDLAAVVSSGSMQC